MMLLTNKKIKGKKDVHNIVRQYDARIKTGLVKWKN